MHDTDKPTWVVLLDSEQMRVFERIRPGAELYELEALAMVAQQPAPARRRPYRVHDRFGPGRHAIEPRATPRELAKTRFVEKAAAQLGAWAEAYAYGALIICAPPHALGALRQAIPQAIGSRLKCAIDRDFVRNRRTELARHLEKD